MAKMARSVLLRLMDGIGIAFLCPMHYGYKTYASDAYRYLTLRLQWISTDFNT